MFPSNKAIAATALSVAFSAASLAQPANARTPADAADTTRVRARAPLVVSAADLADRPAAFEGTRIAITAEIARVFDPGLLTLDGNKIDVGPDVLVLLHSPPTRPLLHGSTVTVTGVVEQIADAELYADADWYNAAARRAHDFSTLLVLVAEAVEADHELLVGPENRGDSESPMIVEVGRLARHPALYFGRVVTLRGQVDTIKGRRSFTLDKDDLGLEPDVLVYDDGGVASRREGQELIVTGAVRPLIATPLSGLDHGWREPLRGFGLPRDQRPVVVAESITVMAAADAAEP